MALFVTNTLGNICTEALALLNVIDNEASVPAEDMERAAKQLQLMLKTWQAEGATIWMRREVEFATVDGTAGYDLVDKSITTFEVVSAVIQESGDDERTQLRAISRQEYMRLSDHTLEGKPIYYLTQFTHNDEDITFWPVPDAIYDVKVDYKLAFTNQDERTDTLEIPNYLMEAAAWCLAERLLVPYGKSGTPMAEHIIVRAKDLYDTAMAFDVIQDGGGVVQFVPEWR
jgi:hypothetical protein